MPTVLKRYWHTLRHLRPVQVYGRIWFRIARPFISTSSSLKLRKATGRWSEPARKGPSLVGPDEFLLLGKRGLLSEIGWNGTQCDKHWRYHQHYFDDLNAEAAENRSAWHLALLEDWVKRNPPGEGDGWAPYPIAARVVNWIKWALAGNTLPQACVDSMALQVRWLARRLEIHLLGNHLLVNAKGLVFAGLFFEGKEARKWLDLGMKIFAREIPEQILSDGGHFERSPMYHAIVLEDMLDLCNMANTYPDAVAVSQVPQIEDWRRRIAGMRHWLFAMCHPDGEIAFFNDAAMDVATSLAELEDYAVRLGFGPSVALENVIWLKSSGYARLTSDSATLLLDMAPVGPDYLPGHAHADTLSFELSLFGSRVLVNSGTSLYGTSPERLRQRGTAAHNTVIVNGVDSSEVWSGFRVARRARPFGSSVSTNGLQVAKCSHDGYHRLPGKPTHTRRWELGPVGLDVYDTVSPETAQAEARFHFHPDIMLDAQDGARSGSGVLPCGCRFTWRVLAGAPRLEDTSWHPRFGESQWNKCLAVRLESGAAHLRLDWA
jgi:uncharacterized heparinase superfamily protein